MRRRHRTVTAAPNRRCCNRSSRRGTRSCHAVSCMKRRLKRPLNRKPRAAPHKERPIRSQWFYLFPFSRNHPLSVTSQNSSIFSTESSVASAPDAADQDDPSARHQRPCTHCGLPTPTNDPDSDQPLFCCAGCHGAYELIHGWGLDDYYALRDRTRAGDATPTRGEKSRYEAFDSEAFLGLSKPVRQADGIVSAELALHGLHCGACAWLIENAAARTVGWRSARVKLSDHTLRLLFDPTRIRLSQIARLLDRLGYELAPLTKNPDDHFRRENRQLLIQVAIAGFCAANAMWIAVALYAGAASGVAADHRFFLRMIGTGLGVAAVVFPGRTFFVGAWASLRTRTPHMDLPVALGLSVGTLVGGINAISGRGEIYFDSLAVLVFLLLIGRWIQFHQQHRAAKAVDLLLRITPSHARRLISAGQTEWVLADALQIGETIRVAAGESLPADGTIIAGQSILDRSLLTGESRPVEVNPGGAVSAGTVNVLRSIDLRVAAVGRDSRIGKVMQSVERAAADKTPVVQLADRIGGVFVVVVTILALVVLAVWSQAGLAIAASHATSLLIVACPCALALATPLAIAVSLGRAAKRKILIRDGASLQQLSSGGILWLDKTGTLTRGRPEARLTWGSVEAARHAARVESQCMHPTAEAIVRYFADDQQSWDDVSLSEVARNGVSGYSGKHRVEVGNVEFSQQRTIAISQAASDAVERCLAAGASPLVVGIDGHAEAVLAVADPLKPGAAGMVSQLKQRGWRVGILSGDHPEIVERVAEQLDIESSLALGGLSPEQKLAIVSHSPEQDEPSQPPRRCVVMIGDGANDAAALAAADVGIAVRGGAEVSLQAAPIFIASGNLSSVQELFCGARRTSLLIYTAFAVSLTYNVVAVALAMAGQISPLTAAILMPISSVSVLSLTLAWPTFTRLN